MKQRALLLLVLILGAFAAPLVYAQTFWEASNGLFMGKIETFSSPSDAFILASSASGVFRSTDGGKSWTKTDLDQLAWFLVADTAERLFAGTRTKGVFRSTNSGINWVPVNSGFTTLEVRGLTACPNGNTVAITASGIFRLAPHDTTWTLLNESMWKYDLVVLASDSKNQLFAGAPSGRTYRSTDGGVTWVNLDVTDPRRVMRTIFIDRNDCIFRSLGVQGIQRSTDNGDTWTLVNTEDVGAFDADSTGILIGGTGSGVIRSSDRGVTWERTTGPYALAITALDNGTVLASGLNGEILRSVDRGMSFTSQATSPRGCVTALATGSNGLVFAGSFALGVFRSTSGGALWTEADSGLANRAVNSLVITPNKNILVGTQQGVFTSVDSGESWTETDTGLTTRWTNDLFVDAAGQLFAATNGGGLFVSVDNAATWQPSGYGVISPAIRKLADGPNGTIYAACYPGGVYRSTDGGAHWQFLSNAYGQYDCVRSLTADSNGRVCAATESLLMCSDDNGKHWRSVSYAFGGRLWTVFLDLSGHLYLSTEGGKVYRSNDFGATWSDFSSGLPVSGTAISCFAVGGDGRLFAGTCNGVYRTVGPTVSTVHERIQPILQSTLAQNYPNPFNPTTGIRFQVSGVSNVNLVLYDLLGREVAVLVNERKVAGTYEVTYDGTGLPSGVYFYRLTAGSFVQTRKLCLLR